MTAPADRATRPADCSAEPAHKNGFVDLLRAPPSQPLVAVKDNIAVKGCRQTAGLAAHQNRRATADAPAVTRLRAAGFAIAGTTVTDCAGFGTMTPEVENPRHPERAVGGSSGGAAAAVAAGDAVVGLGTDTGGSVRIPAAYCDLWALKPSLGRTPMDGIIPLAPTFDVAGLLADTPHALHAAAAALLTGWTEGAVGPPNIAIDGAALRVLDERVAGPFQDIAATLDITRTARAIVPHRAMEAAHAVLVCAEALAVHGADFAANPDGFPPRIAEVIAFARALLPTDIASARATVDKARVTARNRIRPEHLDVLISPTLAMPPGKRYARTAAINRRTTSITNANIRLTLAANVWGLPVVVAPVNGLSVQFTGPFGADEALLAHARALVGRMV